MTSKKTIAFASPKIDAASVEYKQQPATGLNTDTATKDDVAKGLRLVLGFAKDDQVTVLKAEDERGMRHVRIAYPAEAQESIDRLKEALGDVARNITRGSTTVTRKSKAFGTICVGANTLEFDINTSERDMVRARVAEFANAEAALQDKAAGTTHMLDSLAAIQQPKKARNLWY